VPAHLLGLGSFKEWIKCPLSRAASQLSNSVVFYAFSFLVKTPRRAVWGDSGFLYFCADKSAKEFLVKKLRVFLATLAIVLTFGLAFTSCGGDGGGGGNGGSNNPFIGTWTWIGSSGITITIRVQNSTWDYREEGYGITDSDSGTYTYSGYNARFIDYSGSEWGTVSVSGNKLAVYTQNSGSYILTKR
jgi:hypothetical protein